MKRAARVLTVAWTALAVIAPSIAVGVESGHSADAKPSPRDDSDGPDRSMDAIEKSIEREKRLWRNLSGSICAGCTTTANRIVSKPSEPRPSGHRQ